jgi:V/A-type H+-transporting ATPase subunit G/H
LSLEAIKCISEAEEEARQAKLRAQQNARASVEEAEKAGKEAVSSSQARADTEIAELLRMADQKAAEQAVELASTTANRQATLRARAGSRLDKAAAYIIERIVDV